MNDLVDSVSSQTGGDCGLVSAPAGSALHHRWNSAVEFFVLGAEVTEELVRTLPYLGVEPSFSSGYQNV